MKPSGITAVSSSSYQEEVRPSVTMWRARDQAAGKWGRRPLGPAWTRQRTPWPEPARAPWSSRGQALVHIQSPAAH